MGFAEYYRTEFRHDLIELDKKVRSRREEIKREYNGMHDFNDLTFQAHDLSREWGCTDFLSESRRALFAAALFLTVLVDEVAYSYFPYREFRKLTMYPKVVGDCPGACNYHYSPEQMLRAMGYSLDWAESDALIIATFHEAYPIMQGEVLRFFEDYQLGINGREFWEICTRFIPGVLRPSGNLFTNENRR